MLPHPSNNPRPKKPPTDWAAVMTAALIYGAGMLLGYWLVDRVMRFLARDATNWSPFGELLLLSFSLPVGAIGGAIVVWLIRTLSRLVRIVSMRFGIGWGGSRRMVVSPVCRSCGRHATDEERVTSGLCPGCREPLFYWVEGRDSYQPTAKGAVGSRPFIDTGEL